jgi:inhibitor of KinA
MIKNIVNLGDAAVYCDFGNEVNKEVNLKVIKYFETLKEKNFKGITNMAPSYNKLIITFDLNETSFTDLKKKILDLNIKNKTNHEGCKVSIPICCEEEYSLDIERLEKKLNKSKREIIKIFINKNYFCYMTGFVAGMPFLGDIDNKIQLNRLETPRVKVPKGSVGLTEQFCNVYTYESPGGWNIIGNTPLNLFSPTNEKKPNLISPGDEVVFYEINKKDYLKIYES